MKFNKASLNTIFINPTGQGLVEYLIIVAIVAVGSISVVKVVGANLNVQLTNVAQALGGTNSQKKTAYEVPASAWKKKDLSNFFTDSVNSNGGASGGSQ